MKRIILCTALFLAVVFATWNVVPVFADGCPENEGYACIQFSPGDTKVLNIPGPDIITQVWINGTVYKANVVSSTLEIRGIGTNSILVSTPGRDVGEVGVMIVTPTVPPPLAETTVPTATETTVPTATETTVPIATETTVPIATETTVPIATEISIPPISFIIVGISLLIVLTVTIIIVKRKSK